MARTRAGATRRSRRWSRSARARCPRWSRRAAAPAPACASLWATRPPGSAARRRSTRRTRGRRAPPRFADLSRRLDLVSLATPAITSSAIARLPEADLATQLALVQFLGLLRARSAVVPILEVGGDEALAQVALGALAEIGAPAAEELDLAWSRLSPERRPAATVVLRPIDGA